MYWRESEKDGKFLLETESGCFASFSGDGDIGLSPRIEYLQFESREGRHYYKTVREVREQLAKSQGEVRSLERSIKGCVTKKGHVRRKRLLLLVADIDAPKPEINPAMEEILKKIDDRSYSPEAH